MRILGVDPGSRVSGFGVIDVEGPRIKALEYGVIKTPAKSELPLRLAVIYRALDGIIVRTVPDVVVIEEIFYRKNFKSAVMIGETRGIAMLAAANRKTRVLGYPPARVKQSVVGNGRAVKAQVQTMVSRILGLAEVPPEDAADALAIALCHSHQLKATHVQLH